MTEPQDVWLLLGCVGLLIGIMSCIGAWIERVRPIRGLFFLVLGAIGLVQAVRLSEDAMAWYDPLEAAVRVFATVF